ncbi:MAG TPA: STAS domain-containing protein [Acidimicrobiales bacterium]|nr:STAS domain-containing protein [Acidimicrobiales bacterium]
MDRRPRRAAQVSEVECPACGATVSFNRDKIVPGPHYASIPCPSCGAPVPMQWSRLLRAPRLRDERTHDRLIGREPLRIAVEEHDGARHTVVVLRGELDLLSAKNVDACLDSLVARRADVVVDLTHVDFIDSVGLLVLFEARIRASRLGLSLTLRRPAGHVARVLGLARWPDGHIRD